MHFTISGQLYSVRIAARPLVLDGQPRRAKLDRIRRIIWISDQVLRHERRLELLHELKHLWLDQHGRPTDDESDAVQSAAWMDEMLEQYLQQGGDAILEALDPPADSQIHKQPSGAMARTECHCGYCEAPMACGSIPAESPVWNQDIGSWTVNRGMLCAVCDRVTVWRESATSEGMPTGCIIPFPPPRVLSGAEAGEWIGEHRETCRVVTG